MESRSIRTSTARLVLPTLLALLAIPALSRAAGEDDSEVATSVWVNDRQHDMNARLAEAERKVAAGEWEGAANLYQDAADRARDEVVKIGPRTYLGVREYVNGKISRWPAEGLEAYRRVVDARAGQMYRQALEGDRPLELGELARRYVMSSFGPPAHLALGTRELTRGNTEIALRHLLEILRYYPEGPIPGVRRENVLARAAVAAAKRGDGILVRELAVLGARLPEDSTVVVGGTTRPLSGFLSELRAVPAGTRAPRGWTTAGGCAARSGGHDGPDGPLVLYWAWPVPYGKPATEEEENGPRSPLLPLCPLITDDLVIVIGQMAAYGLPIPATPWSAEGEGGVHPEPLWTYPGLLEEDLEEMETGSNARVGIPPLLGTVHGDRVYFPFRDDSSPLYADETSRLETLVALSLSLQGTLVGLRGGTGDPLHGEEYGRTEFSGAPAVVGDRLYVAGTRSGDRVETLAYCFDVSRGPEMPRQVWKTSLCLGSGQEDDALGSIFSRDRMPATSVATRNGVVFLCSNTGAVGALDAVSGEILWIHAYEQAVARDDVLTRRIKPGRTWFPNPPVLDDRFLYVAPLDADALFIYFQLPDVRTGFVQHGRFGRDDIVNGFDPEYLLGVRNGAVFVAGSTRSLSERPLFAVKAGPERFETQPDPERMLPYVWRAEIEEDAPRGRGAAAGDAIYFPTEKAIYRVSAVDGSWTRVVNLTDPKLREATGDRAVAGNLAVAGPWLVTASEELVCLFGPPPPPEKEEPRKED